MPRWLERLLAVAGVTLLAGGAAHLGGVAHLYATDHVPGADRVLLDWWIGQAQLVGGALFVAAWRESRRGASGRGLALAGAVVVGGYSAAFVPVLVARSPARFWVPAIAYLVASLVVLVGALARGHPGPGR